MSRKAAFYVGNNPSGTGSWVARALRQWEQRQRGESPKCDFSHIFTGQRDSVPGFVPGGREKGEEEES